MAAMDWKTMLSYMHLDQNVLASLRCSTRASILGLSGGLFTAATRPPVSAGWCFRHQVLVI